MSDAQRPSGIFGMSLITLVMLAVLLSLGSWQLQRRVEKHAVIAALDQRIASAPEALPPVAEWGALTPARDEFRRVTFTATFPTKQEARVYTSGSGLRPDVTGTGAWIIALAELPDGRKVVVNRGFAPGSVPGGGSQPDAPVPPGSADGRDVTLVGYLRFPELPGMLTPEVDRARRLWFVRDHADMAKSLDWAADTSEIAPFYIDLETPVPPGGWPKPGKLSPKLSDNHLQYALTWFGLAAVVAIAYGFWLAGALRGRRPPK